MTAVIVPAHNEAAGIERILTVIAESRYVTQIITVANGCTDDTAAIAREFGAVVETTTADKGTAMAQGVAQVIDPTVAFIDADLSGLAPGHVDALCTYPPLDGMVAALDDSWGAQSGLPPITGERRLPTAFAQSVPLVGTGYRAELLIDAAVGRAGLPHSHFIMKGVRNPRRPWRHPLMLIDLALVVVTHAPSLIDYTATKQ